jgi:single-strand DNA-binding protein
MSYNKVILMGNLTREPEVTFAQSGTAICKFGMAMNHKYKDNETVVFVDVVMFGKRGEAFAKWHAKGVQAFIEGRLNYETWQDRETGANRNRLSVVAERWEFTSGKRREETEDPHADQPF